MQQPDGGNTKNMILAMGLTMAILVGWSVFFDQPPVAPDTPEATQVDGIDTASKPTLNADTNPADASKPGLPGATIAPTTNTVADTSARINIETPALSGSIRLKGARLDDLVLTQYNDKVDGTGEDITLLARDSDAKAYHADFGWLGQNQNGTPMVNLPDSNTVWSLERGRTLTPTTPVTLSYDAGNGLLFRREISVDDKYVFTIKDFVQNDSDASATVYSYGMITRSQIQDVSSFFILHEGPIGYLGDKLIDPKYDDLDGASKSYPSTGGWAGMTDKYWLTALIPPQDQQIKVTYRQTQQGATKQYIADYVGPALVVNSGTSKSYTNHFFAGAKVLDLLDAYEQDLGIKHFDLAVDFGWFYFLTKPIFHLLNLAKDYLGNFGLGILLLTVILKLLFFPLANKSYRSMARMKQLQPKMAKLKEDHKDDRMAMNQALMELYKKEKVNPMAGCLPMVIQIPVFFALYKVLFVSIEMRHAPFYGWIHDLSAPDPTSIVNLFGLLPYDAPSFLGFLNIGVWPLIMGLTMFLQQKLNPAPQDPIQEKMFLAMPIVFTFMLASFPAGLVIYWAWNNTLTIAQQWTIMRLEAKRKSK